MNNIIKNKRESIEQLCQQYHVAKLEVFGSVTKDTFNPNKSDIDFLVEFSSEGLSAYADNYFGLQSALKDLFKLPVELVVSSTIKNPYFLESIKTDRTFLYAA